MAVPWRVNDGDFGQLLEIGRDLSFPFTSVGDSESFEYVIKYRQDKDAFRKLPLMTSIEFPLGVAYFVDQSDPQDMGNGEYEFTRTFASLPLTRTEGQSVVWTLTVFTPSGPTSVRADYTAITTADVVYEYYLNEKPKPIIAPRWYFAGLVPKRITVQDSEVGIYKGKIYYRKSIFANIDEIRLAWPA